MIPVQVTAAELTLRYDHHLFTIDPSAHPEWKRTQEVWVLHGERVLPATSWRVDSDAFVTFPEGLVRYLELVWDEDAIARTLQRKIATKLNRTPGKVTIARTATGVVFDGIGMLGRVLDLGIAASLTASALEQGISDIVLPVTELQPKITVNDPELRSLGISEVVAVGESDFSFSPYARRHNIAVGLSKFNGHLISQGSTFSFNEVLGPVNKQTGYWQELVIQGDRTIPEYGGGLCQVSTTAYRGVWEQGFPIAYRRNHSFAVSYYGPQGTDATIYPPFTDMQFVNDGPSDLLIQTVFDPPYAYFIYYGTKDNRKSEIIGPYTWNKKPPLPDRIEYTTEIPPGAERKLGERVAGMYSAWFRVVQTVDEKERLEPFYSEYQARPYYVQIGMETEFTELQGSIGDRASQRAKLRSE